MINLVSWDYEFQWLDLHTCIFAIFNVFPNVAKVGGLQSQGVKGEIVVGYLDPLTTQDLKSSGFPVG